MKNPSKFFPQTAEICELLDISVYSDLRINEKCPDDIEQMVPTYYFGFHRELSAGLVGGALDKLPSFSSMEEVETYVQGHREEIIDASGIDLNN